MLTRFRAQVYGPRDMLFLHNMLGAGNKLRIFGTVRCGCKEHLATAPLASARLR